MRRTRSSPGRVSNPLRDLLAERNRVAELARVRQRTRPPRGEDLPSLIDERVGEQMEKLEARLVEGFREIGKKVVEQGTEALTASLDTRIRELEQISMVQTDNVTRLRDASRLSEEKVSGVVSNIEQALSSAVPGFRLSPASHAPAELAPPPSDPRELVAALDRSSVEEVRLPNMFCPNCTSVHVRRASRSGVWEEFLRLFFIAPFRCRACRHKFYRF
jgi:hypothetical protein